MKQEQRFYHRGNYLQATLLIAIARTKKYDCNEIISQNCVQVWCTDEEWVKLLKEVINS